MKCPHCGKKVDADPQSPEALLLWLKKNERDAENHVNLTKEYSPDNTVKIKQIKQREQKLAQWTTWAKWVESKIANRK